MSNTPLEHQKAKTLKSDPELPKQELDEPFDFGILSDKMSTQELATREKDKERKEKRYFSAFWLIIGCLIFLAVIYGVEVFASYKLENGLSAHTDGIIEIIKTLLFTLSGYLFGRKSNS